MEKHIPYDLLIVEIDKLIARFKEKEAKHKANLEGYGEMMAFGAHHSLETLKDQLIFIPKITITEEISENEAS